MTWRDWTIFAVLLVCGVVVLAVLWLAPCTVAQRTLCSGYLAALTWITLIGRAELGRTLAQVSSNPQLPAAAVNDPLERAWARECPHCLRPAKACDGEDRTSGFLFEGCLERRDREAGEAASLAAAEAQQAGEPVVMVTQSGEL